ncbi:MAG: hypothetical protein A2219_03980 [Elusimicrobia bacterium RIFOXYA2_FULL_50_26]|nr:MAG: hypothetical protein A2219_03980 [Elusimicrobia bacterium RIFOXYA2_FULL_50_26]OGS23400.1 MAG: hypothetical protein A2314_00575 [Elusimicrobia bacterium RIFOXYB2_FULL_50_12]
MKKPAKKFFNLAEVCKQLQITRNTYYNWEAAGKIPKARRDPMNNYRLYTFKQIMKLKKITGR